MFCGATTTSHSLHLSEQQSLFTQPQEAEHDQCYSFPGEPPLKQYSFISLDTLGEEQQAENTTLMYYHLIKLLANVAFAHQEDTELYYHLFGVIFLSTQQMKYKYSLSFCSILRAVRVNQNSKVADQKTKTVSWKKLKSSVELRGTKESSDNSRGFH